MSMLRQPRMVRILSGLVIIVLITVSALAIAWRGPYGSGEGDFATFRRERGLRNPRLPIAYVREKLENGAGLSAKLSPARRRKSTTTGLPGTFINLDQSMAAAQAYNAVDQRTPAAAATDSIKSGVELEGAWPDHAECGRAGDVRSRWLTHSGPRDSAGGEPKLRHRQMHAVCRRGWRRRLGSDNALAAKPSARPSSNGIPSNAIGSLIVDPADASGKTLYVGTGEPNGSSDSGPASACINRPTAARAGRWCPAACRWPGSRDRRGGDRPDRRRSCLHRHSASPPRHVVGGPAGATPAQRAESGVYESTDGGATFTLVFSQAGDPVDPGSPNGSDFFSGGVTDIELDPRDPATVYAGLFNWPVAPLGQP